MSLLAGRLEQVGAPGHLLATWFASTLRDVFALSAASAYADFAEIARDALRSILAAVGDLAREPDEATEFVLAGMRELPRRPGERLDQPHCRSVPGLIPSTRSHVSRLRRAGGCSGQADRSPG